MGDSVASVKIVNQMILVAVFVREKRAIDDVSASYEYFGTHKETRTKWRNVKQAIVSRSKTVDGKNSVPDVGGESSKILSRFRWNSPSRNPNLRHFSSCNDHASWLYMNAK
jgi:hypothetical protein